jgi:hypothetical protein
VTADAIIAMTVSFVVVVYVQIVEFTKLARGVLRRHVRTRRFRHAVSVIRDLDRFEALIVKFHLRLNIITRAANW